MTREKAARLSNPHIQEILRAYAQGKTIEFCHSYFEVWSECSGGPDPQDDLNATYRIKPEPKLRPWKSSEVPVGALLKHNNDTVHRYLILDVDDEGVTVHFRNSLRNFESAHIAFGLLVKWHSHSLDGGKTWSPCGILEAQ